MLTEDRKRTGLLFNVPVGGNITIGNLALFARHGLISGEREENAAVKAMRELKVKARSSAAAVAHLSGGNQQKLLFARVLMNAPKILLLDEPTKGVDVGTRSEIYRQVERLFDDADVFITPTVATPALPIGQQSDGPLVVDGIDHGPLRDAWYPYTIPYNASGHPALSVPCGMSPDGLPIGLQIVGRWHSEARLLAVAVAIEALKPWGANWPALSGKEQLA